jgi:hypothetical protein
MQSAIERELRRVLGEDRAPGRSPGAGDGAMAAAGYRTAGRHRPCPTCDHELERVVVAVRTPAPLTGLSSIAARLRWRLETRGPWEDVADPADRRVRAPVRVMPALVEARRNVEFHRSFTAD